MPLPAAGRARGTWPAGRRPWSGPASAGGRQLQGLVRQAQPERTGEGEREPKHRRPRRRLRCPTRPTRPRGGQDSNSYRNRAARRREEAPRWREARLQGEEGFLLSPMPAGLSNDLLLSCRPAGRHPRLAGLPRECRPKALQLAKAEGGQLQQLVRRRRTSRGFC